jgi:hypothetical protein
MKHFLVSFFFLLSCHAFVGQDSLASRFTCSVFHKTSLAKASVLDNGGPANLDFIYNEKVSDIVTNGFGINLSKSFASRFSFMVGLEREVLGYKTESMPSVGLKWVRYKMGYVQVPLKLQYQVTSNSKWIVLGRVGVCARYMTDLNVDYRLQDGFENQVFDTPTGYTKFAYAGLVDMGVQKSISPNLSFGLEFCSAFQLANVFSENLWLRSSSYGISLRLNRHF